MSIDDPTDEVELVRDAFDPLARPMATPTVAIAGASGFVGRALAHALAPSHHVIGLGRASTPPAAAAEDAIWRRCDLFSLLDAERALADTDVGVYLVHSMLPTSHVAEGRFADLDLICADNFARAARRQNVKRIVYLGGLVPSDDAGGAISPHLRSRLEVERALAAHGVPLVALRASLVIGRGGSSFEMMVRLVERLPAMICPSWTRTPIQPIALPDVVALLARAIDDPRLPPGSYDVGGPEVVTLRELMRMTAKLLGVRRAMVSVPLFSPGLSRLWVSTFTGAPRALVAPLVKSLRTPMVARDRRLQEQVGLPGVPIETALERALAGRVRPKRGKRPKRSRHALRELTAPAGEVRSVQRLPLPSGHDARWIADEYLRWLPLHLRYLLRVDITRARGEGRPAPILCRFRLRLLRRPLIELRFSPERSTLDRPLFYVTGGLLARRSPSQGRLEFRQIPDENTVLAALHDYTPRLPFAIYAATQGLVHRWVMASFRRHLRRLAREASS
jgi:nucleoside-diphosphate-sugar epimerase